MLMNALSYKMIVIQDMPHVPTPLAVLSVSVFLVLREMEERVKVSNYSHTCYGGGVNSVTM